MNPANQTNESDTLEKIMRDIEKKTEAKVMMAYANNDLKVNTFDKKNNSHSQKVLVNIMNDGNADFEKRTGREMSYSEMRAMYG